MLPLIALLGCFGGTLVIMGVCMVGAYIKTDQGRFSRKRMPVQSR